MFCLQKYQVHNKSVCVVLSKKRLRVLILINVLIMKFSKTKTTQLRY